MCHLPLTSTPVLKFVSALFKGPCQVAQLTPFRIASLFVLCSQISIDSVSLILWKVLPRKLDGMSGLSAFVSLMVFFQEVKCLACDNVKALMVLSEYLLAN